MKRLISVCLAAVLLLSLGGVSALADHEDRGGWYVSFEPNRKMKSNFSTEDMDDVLLGLQPGDSASFTIELKNNHPETTDWYMTNEVLQSLEESMNAAEGSNYHYKLTYYDHAGGETELFNSSSVGGEEKDAGPDLIGLHEATSSLEDYFQLDTLRRYQSGKVVLEVVYEGESHGNGYQDTLAKLQMNFAVELPGYSPVRTGDESSLLLWSGIMLCCGLAALALGVQSLRAGRGKRGGHTHG